MRHSETCGCPVCQGVERVNPLQASEVAMLQNSSPPLKMDVHYGPKRLLIVYNQQHFNSQQIATMCDWMGHRGFNIWALKTYDDLAEDIRVFDLDGVPAPDTGLIRQLLAGIAANDGKVWTPGGEFIPVADACEECEGAGQVTTDRAGCLSCGGSGRKKQIAKTG